MNLALFPFAALLVLLAGFTSQAQAGGSSRSSEAGLRAGPLPQNLLREWFRVGGSGRQASTLVRHRARLRAQLRTQLRAQLRAVRARLILSRGQTPLPAVVLTEFSRQPVAAVASALPPGSSPGRGRKAFRTRFGFAEGAYQPLGPPARA